MAAKMARYFERVSVRLVTGKLTCTVEAFGSTAAYVKVINREGEEVVELTEENVRDMLVACKEIKKAAKVADDMLPYVQRDEE
jgi:hypothetical protein